MSSTPQQRLAQAEATARRWYRILGSLAVKDTSDEVFSAAHRVAAELAVRLQREGAEPPPPARRS